MTHVPRVIERPVRGLPRVGFPLSRRVSADALGREEGELTRLRRVVLCDPGRDQRVDARWVLLVREVAGFVEALGAQTAREDRLRNVLVEARV